jgi:hypothetical protein
VGYLGQQVLPFNPAATFAPPRDADRFSGNGSSVTFTLSRPVNQETDIEVFVENVQQEPIVAYSSAATTLTFTEAPPSGTNNVYVVYKNYNTGAQVIVPDGSISYAKLANNIRLFTTDNLTANGSQVTFTLSEIPADANTVMVSVDGVVQRAPVHYTTSGNQITFTSAPPALSNVHIRHLGFRTTSTVTAIQVGTFIPQPNIATPTITGNVSISGSIIPSANTTHDLGSASLRWANIYTGDLHLSNEGRDSGNMVDGTKGNWTLQEGQTDLYLINNITGKKYRFAIEEIQ